MKYEGHDREKIQLACFKIHEVWKMGGEKW